MEISKVLFISQEITPYLPESEMATIGREIPQGIQEKHGVEVRTFMPKYGFINERRNQLHEVIRLSGMNVIIDDSDHPLVIKVATLLPTRMQVYFIYNDDYFAPSLTKELETIESPEDNDERIIFFVRGVIETVRKLRWAPAVIQCSGWIDAIAPMYMRLNYNDDPSICDAKIILGLFDEDLPAPLGKDFAKKLMFDGIKTPEVKALVDKNATYLDLLKLGLPYCDGVIKYAKKVKPEVLALVKESGKPFVDVADSDNMVEDVFNFYQSF